MQYTELSVGLSLNVTTGESWWKADAKVSLLPEENIFDVADKMKADISQIIQRQSSNEEMKGTIIKPVETAEDTFIREIGECTEYDKVNAMGVQVGLVAYQSLANQSDAIQKAYDKKLKQLQ